MNQSRLNHLVNSIQVESLFSTYVLLNTYLSKDVIMRGRAFGSQLGDSRMQDGLVQGYKLILVATLDSYINGVVRSPELLGIEVDLDYRDYWAFTKGRGREITRSAARSDHYISQFVAKANSLISDLISLNTLDELESFGVGTQSFRDCLFRISQKAFAAYKNSKEVTIGEALLEASAGILSSTSGNRLPIQHMYTDYFISRKNNDVGLRLEDMVHDCDPSSGATRLDYSRIPTSDMPRPLPRHWALGYAFALHESLKQLARNTRQRRQLRSIDSVVRSTENWRDVVSYSRKLTSVYGPPKAYHGYTYTLRAEITNNDREPLTTRVESSISPERLLSIFGNRARIVERGSPPAYSSFECLLDGAIARSRKAKEKAKIALIVHGTQKQHEDYSAAVFMPAYGFMSNASMWWVFYKIGNNHSGSASRAMKQVRSKIQRNEKNLDVVVVKADEDEFYAYCEDPGYIRLGGLMAASNRIVGEIRGAFPELLLANMLTNMQYTKVLNRYRPRILKAVDGELDVVGVRCTGELPSQILVFESKGRGTNQLELQNDINRFSRTIDIVRSQLREFCLELGLPYIEDIEVKAIFVSMGDLKTDVGGSLEVGPFVFRTPKCETPENIELWDYSDLISNLSKHHVPTAYLRLLRKMQIAVIMNQPGATHSPQATGLTHENRTRPA